jgi:hypothetical protein
VIRRFCGVQEAEAVIQSAMAGRGQDRLVDVDAPTMKQSVAWELALRVIHIREVTTRAVISQLTWSARLLHARTACRHVHYRATCC